VVWITTATPRLRSRVISSVLKPRCVAEAVTTVWLVNWGVLDTPAIGWALGLERLLLVLEETAKADPTGRACPAHVCAEAGCLPGQPWRAG
jgi:hypothetical protein